MCIFTQSVDLVSDTAIFARGLNSNQFLVYSMTYSAHSQLAMVLPLPIPPGAGENAVRFINLAGYPRFFLDMQDGFEMDSFSSWGNAPRSWAMPDSMLQVHDVGEFEASFVPAIIDFDRLDERFRIPRDVWAKLPNYQDFGFAVFKLKETAVRRSTGILAKLGGGESGQDEVKPKLVHPMAFEFPRQNPNALYFPTMHVHDGKVHDRAVFDHTLYCQGAEAKSDSKWEETAVPASDFLEIDKAEGLVDSQASCFRQSLHGQLPNADTFVGEGRYIPSQ